MPHAPCSYLQPGDLARLRRLAFVPQRRVQGTHVGQHAAQGKGQSVTFCDYRPYTPGDPLHQVDWKVFGRSDKLLLKRFEQQSHLTAQLLIDASASMAYRGTSSPSLSKFDQACRCAMAIAFLTMQQQDKVGLALAQEGLAHFIAPQSTGAHLQACVQTLETFKPQREARLAQSLHALADKARQPGLLFLFSDLLEDPRAILQAISRWIHRGHEAIVFQVLHDDEQQLPDAWDQTLMIDSETGQRLHLNVQEVRDTYEQAMRQAQHLWRTQLRAKGIDFNVVSTATPYDQALERYLVTRANSH